MEADCGCKIELERVSVNDPLIVFCPLHAAAENTLIALRAITLAVKMEGYSGAWKDLLTYCDKFIAKAEGK